MGTGTAFIDSTALPASGTYTILIDPTGANTGSATLRLNPVTDLTGTIVPGTPLDVTFATPGQNARFTFSGAANQRISLRITNVTVASSSVAILNPDGTTLASAGVGTVGGFIDTRTLSGTGTYTVLVDPVSTSVGSLRLTLYNVPPDATGTMVVGGTAFVLAFETPGQNAEIEFSGTASQQLTLQGSAAMTGSSTVSILNPDGSVLASQAFSVNSGTIEGIALPATGTYRIAVDPSGATTGSMTLVLFDASDVFATITAAGPPVTVTISAAGGKARVTFDGAAGQRVSLGLTNVTIGTSGCCSLRVSILRPDGSALASPAFVGTGGGFVDVRTVDVAGTYTIIIDPESTNTGSVTLTLHNVPPDYSASITPGGPTVTVTTSTPGQNAQLSFAGTAGQRVSLYMSGVTIPKSTVSLIAPDGTTIASRLVFSAAAFIDVETLETSGTYAILVNPSTSETGSMTLTLHEVPPDVTGAMVPGGDPVTVTIDVPGQGAVLTFPGASGQRISLRITGVTVGTTSVAILRPDGSTHVSTLMSTSGAFFDATVLTMSGTHSVRLNPSSADTGSMVLTLYDVPPDPTATITVGGPAAPIAITTPGQNASVLFEGTSGEQVTIRISGNTVGTLTVKLLRPDGTTVTTGISQSTNFSLAAQTLGVSGTYTISINPSGSKTGMLNVYVTSP